MKDANIRADLVRCGRLIPADDPRPLELPPGDVDTSTDSTEVIADLREDRL